MNAALKVSSITQTNTSVLDAGTGELLENSESLKQTFRVSKEPSFVKLYLDCLSVFHDTQISLNPILLEFLKSATYADIEDSEGGQILYLNSALKKRIASKTEVSVSRVNQAITEFVKKGIMRRVDIGAYQFNAELFGKGDWSDIANLRNIQSNIDFANHKITTEFIIDDKDDNHVQNN